MGSVQAGRIRGGDSLSDLRGGARKRCQKSPGPDHSPLGPPGAARKQWEPLSRRPRGRGAGRRTPGAPPAARRFQLRPPGRAGPRRLPRPLTTLPPPSPQDRTGSQGRGRGLRPLPRPRPALPSSARSGPARQHSRLRQLPGLLPCPAGFSPTHSRPERPPPDPSRAEPGGSEHVGPLHRNRKLPSPRLLAALKPF